MNTHFRPPEMAPTTQAAEGLQRRRWSLAEIEAMVEAGILLEDDRFELIGGEVVPMSPRGSKHESYKASLLNFWMRRIGDNFRIIPETTFRLDDATFLEPDFLFYDAQARVPEIAVSNTLLAVEISDSSFTYDKGRKARIYSNFGVRALWVIDVNTLNTHVFSQPGIDGYQSIKVVGPHELLAPEFAPELAVRLADLKLV